MNGLTNGLVYYEFITQSPIHLVILKRVKWRNDNGLTFTLAKHDIIIKVIKIKTKNKALKQKKSISLITTNKVINNIRINLHFSDVK